MAANGVSVERLNVALQSVLVEKACKSSERRAMSILREMMCLSVFDHFYLV